MKLPRALTSQEAVLALCMLALLAIVGTINERFVAERNLTSMLLAHSYIAVAAIGMTMVIISGNIDISVGSLIGVVGALAGTIATAGMPVWVAWIVPIGAAMLISASLGVLVTVFRIPAIVASLGYLSILKGALIIATGGAWITDLPDAFGLSLMRPLGIPMPVIFMVVLTAAAAWWMRYSRAGRSIYAVGGNTEAAELSGLRPRRIVMMVFVLQGFFTGCAGILYATQLKVIQTTVPLYLELTIITAAVVGGVSILGGSGSVIGAALAAVMLAEIGAALIFVGISPFWIRAAYGTLILITVLVDLHRRGRLARK